ncbi:hypothetical protein [Paenibacillus sp. PL2-23]
MTALYAYLAIWLTGMFGLIMICICGVAELLKQDTWSYDEEHVWMRKVKE